MAQPQRSEPAETLGEACAIRGCLEDAFALEEVSGIGYCPGHLELMIDRWEAIALNPAMRETLPEIEHRIVTAKTYPA